ncbi:MAG: hypothetical protein IJP20_01080 [Clostridia bacterium]|nr:hypothetical protein [Clostridia bacterium]
MKIYCHDYSEANEALYEMKWFRKDIFVETSQGIYHMFFMAIGRLIDEIKHDVQTQGFYIPDDNLVAIDSVDQGSIIKQCIEIGEVGIDYFTPCVQENGIVYFNLSEGEKNMYIESHWDISVNKNDLKLLFDSQK